EVLHQRAKEGPLGVEASQLATPSCRKRGAAAVPRREQAAVLRPREHPRDRTERGEVVLLLRPPRRPRADLEQRELLDRREATEERQEVPVVDEPAVRLEPEPRKVVEQGEVFIMRLGSEDGRKGREQRRRQSCLEGAIREPAQPVVERTGP